MQTLSKPAAYLGNRKPSLPDAKSHQAKAVDYVYSPDNYVLAAFAKASEIRIKKTRRRPAENSVETGVPGNQGE